MKASAREGADLGLLDLVPDGVVVSDASGRIVYANPLAARMTGYARSQLVGLRIEELVPSRLRASHRRDRTSYQAHPKRRPMGSPDRDFKVRRRDGSAFSADIAVGPVGQRADPLFMAVIRDITGHRALEATLAHQALHDPLTGLANRALFFDRLSQAMLQARRDRKQVAVVMLDVDHFKAVNDTYGHQAGDGVLRKVAARLAHGLRSTDTVARIGGDEFAWILPSIGGRHSAAVMMAKLLRSVPARFAVNGQSIELSVSAGLALCPDDAEDVDSLMRVADVELYAAKRQAPNPRTPRRRT